MSCVNTCRFCKKIASEDWLVKDGTRHYAHPTCYIKAGKSVSDLPEYEKRYFDGKLPHWLRLEAQKDCTANLEKTWTTSSRSTAIR
jgi:hypothetical protein